MIFSLTLFLLPVVLYLFFKSKSSNDYHNTSKKVVVVTGCDRGFGKAIVLKLIEDGYTVFAGCLNASNAAKDDSYQSRVGNELHLLQMDVTKKDEIQQSMKQVSDWLDCNKTFKLCSIVANAGIGLTCPSEMMPEEALRQVMEVNFFGVVNSLKIFLPLLRKSEASRKTLVVLSSFSSIAPAQTFTAYGASKAAVRQWANCLRFEVAPFGIRVATICPDFYATDMVANSKVQVDKVDKFVQESDREIVTSYGGRDEIKQRMESLMSTIGKEARTDLQPVLSDVCDAIANKDPQLNYYPIQPVNRVFISLQFFWPKLTLKISQRFFK